MYQLQTMMRPLQRVMSLVLLVSILMLAGGWVLGNLFLGLAMAYDSLLAGLCTLTMTIPPVLVGLPFLVWLFRFSRGGSSVSYLHDLQRHLGVEGQAEGPTLLFTMVSPRWEGLVDDRKVEVLLRRTAGVLSPISPAGGFGLPWTLSCFIACEAPSGIGFCDPGANTTGAGLLGLKQLTEEEGVKVFTGGHERATDPAVLACAREVPFGGALAHTSGTHLQLTERMQGLPAEVVARRLEKLVALAAVLERT